MKTACISSSLVPSSTANSIQMMKVCHALSQVDEPVRLWLPGGGSAAWSDLALQYGLTQSFEVRWLSSARIFRRYDFAWRSVTEAQRWGAQRLYTWMPQAAVLALRRGLPVILELHDRVTGRLGPWLFRQFVQTAGKKRLLVITRALRNQLETQFGDLSGLDIQIAPNGVALEQYDGLPEAPSARAYLGLPEKPTVVYSGHFYAGRGVDLLVGLAAAFPQASFVWVGGRREDLEILHRRLEKQNITNVVLTGFIPNQQLPLYQVAGDILLMPYERSIAGSSGGNSADICSPMKMFDYLAAGRAILSSDLPVFHEVLTPQNAVFCPPEDLSAWKEALAELIEDPARRQQLGSQARRDAENYTWRKRAERALLNFA
ncbi:MAG: glycosyltransferase [Anaerolineae bacterium]|nr:glycosyltransferase [Anaerolineae bacterium]